MGACAVVARQLPSGETQLVAYIVDKAERLSGAEARDWLRHRLPEYMVPSAFEHLHALPMTSNGKLEQSRAARTVPAGNWPRGHALPPRTDTETRVAALWGRPVGRPGDDVTHADFFDLGGHSSLAARLISEVEQTFGVALSLESFIDSGRAVAKLAQLLSAERPSGTGEVTSGPPLHFISCDLATAMSLRHFTERWGSAKPVHALIPEQADGQFDRSVTIEEHARQALSMIRNRQPDGPLALAGYSIGGLVAYEVARQAIDAGQQIEWLGILDPTAPPLERAQSQMRGRLHSVHQQPLRERWAKYAELALRAVRRLLPQRQRGFDLRGAAKIGRRYRQPGHRVPMHLYVSDVSGSSRRRRLVGLGRISPRTRGRASPRR